MADRMTEAELLAALDGVKPDWVGMASRSIAALTGHTLRQSGFVPYQCGYVPHLERTIHDLCAAAARLLAILGTPQVNDPAGDAVEELRAAVKAAKGE